MIGRVKQGGGVGNPGLRSTPTACFTAEYAEVAEVGTEGSVASGFIPDADRRGQAATLQDPVAHEAHKAVADKLRRYNLLRCSASSAVSTVLSQGTKARGKQSSHTPVRPFSKGIR